jgi:hypothetical protein
MTMDQPAAHLDDEALSAAVDGVLDDGADHLDACADCRARRDHLAAARQALLGAPVEPVDDLTRRRLLAAALDEADPATKPRPWYLRPALGGIAAAVAVALVATPFLLDREQTSRDLTAASEAPATAPFLGDLGDVSDPATLRAAFDPQAAAGTSLSEDSAQRNSAADRANEAPTPAPGSAPAAPAAKPPAEAYALRSGGPALDVSFAQACADGLLAKEAKGGRLFATAAATYRNQPAVVVAVIDDRSRRRTVYVLAPDGCQILHRQEL